MYEIVVELGAACAGAKALIANRALAEIATVARRLRFMLNCIFCSSFAVVSVPWRETI